MTTTSESISSTYVTTDTTTIQLEYTNETQYYSTSVMYETSEIPQTSTVTTVKTNSPTASMSTVSPSAESTSYTPMQTTPTTVFTGPETTPSTPTCISPNVTFRYYGSGQNIANPLRKLMSSTVYIRLVLVPREHKTRSPKHRISSQDSR